MTREDLHALQDLVGTEMFDRYRNYQTFTAPVRAEVLMAEIQATLSGPGSFAFAAGAGKTLSLAVGRRLEWDSAFFELPMARVNHVLGTDAGQRREALAGLLSALRADGRRHVAARADIADVATTALLQDQGFRLMGGLSTYVARPGRRPPEVARSFGEIRLMRDEDAPDLVALAAEAFRGVGNRFRADSGLPRDRVEAFYPEWARRCVAHEMADVVLIAEGAGGEPLGFLAFRRVEPVSTASGLPVFGGGLGACRQGASGAYPGLMRAGIAWAHEHGGIAEVQTPSDNFAAIAVFEAVGLRLRGAEHAFHLWLD